MDQDEFQKLLLEKIESIEERTRNIELNQAEALGRRSALGGIGLWLNGIFTLLLGAYFEWKFNRLN
jgi:hypothetical protein